jgi:hypothetical protein
MREMMRFRGLVSMGWGLGLVACGQDAAEPVVGQPMAGGPALGGASFAGAASSGGNAAGGGGAPVTPPVGNGGAAASGGSAGQSAAGMAGTAGSGGTPAVDTCAASPWTCVGVAPDASYGSHVLDVPAAQNWVNTGLYLRTGEQATISESGSWQVSDTGDGLDHGSCKIGDLVARIGLHYKDDQLTCVKGKLTFTADKDGILFVGALTGNDLGETYESRAEASGKKSVTIESEHDTVPTVQSADAKSFAFTTVKSGWVEVWGEHVILTLPTDSALQDAQVMAKATQRLDEIYELEAELRGALPHHGQRLRFFPDGTQPGYMLAGNPVRMDLTLVDGGDETRISRAGETGTDIWGFAHEMGHDFSFAPNGFWTYQESTLESWCNVFSIYSLEKLGLPLHEATLDCTDASTGDYADWDAWGGLCFLRQFQFRYGWDFYKKYFQQIKDSKSTNGDAWKFVYAQFGTASGKDVSPLFDAWNVPH